MEVRGITGKIIFALTLALSRWRERGGVIFLWIWANEAVMQNCSLSFL
jgi:hypothetical protein